MASTLRPGRNFQRIGRIASPRLPKLSIRRRERATAPDAAHEMCPGDDGQLVGPQAAARLVALRLAARVFGKEPGTTNTTSEGPTPKLRATLARISRAACRSV